ncbi:MAG: cytochrome c biogenesis CcdA family protein [Leptospiraceae bacterium]|nr:cytochrome c biogenesis CcdA family protein [Leptospiraceae bacterium]
MIFLIAIAAGLITSLSPCVITALPFIVGSALNKNKWGPVYISAGLIFSFVVLGVTFALTTKVAGVGQEGLRIFSAVLFILFGLVLIIPYLNDQLALKLQGIANRSNHFASKIGTNSSLGFVILGILLGFIWSPCSGPTLGIAVTLVAKEGEIFMGSLIMLVFGISASIPLLGIAYLSRGLVQNNRRGLRWIYSIGKYAMAFLLIVYGILTITGFDRVIESSMLELLPESWLEFITHL